MKLQHHTSVLRVEMLLVMLMGMVSVTTAAFQQLDLNGIWAVSGQNPNGTSISVAGQVPGSMYTALMANGIIGDPLYRDNDVQLAWVGHENWTYSRSFQLSEAMTQAQTILLIAEGVDTVATIFVNGRLLGTTNNMFVKYTFDVTNFVKAGDNTIRFAFQSAVDYSLKAFTSYPYVVPPTCVAGVQHGECHVNFIRKEQCSFSWDWGPSFPTQGIWKPIYLRAFNSAVMDTAAVEVVPDSSGRGWILKTRVFFDLSGHGAVSGDVGFRLDGTSVSETHAITLTPARNTVAFNVTVPQSANIQRWWPNGYGNQTLYDMYIVFTSDSGETTSLHRRVGFRTIELVQDPVSSNLNQGLTFYFRVNGLPVFFKGSNWIPADSFQERITKDYLRTLLQSAVDAHMNSMRVWGGGVFESEDFYDLSDELGILIWQDLMFSVAMYPTDQPFLDTVIQEVTYQIRRLQHRPSILLWAGSNENEAALRQNWFGTSSNYTLYYNDFIKLYVTTIMPLVNTEDPSREYLSSSPSDGKETVKEGYVAQDPGSQLYGDVHFYDYSIDQWVPDKLPVPRFASEFGIEAWCNLETLRSVFKDSDLSYCSAQADHRQHHFAGGTEMEMQVFRHLNLPTASTPEPQRFDNAIYLTQINQAMSIKSQVENYRRHQSKLLADGRGLTMGALYWQLNDIWQAPTWASIDYSGRWKMLHYYALKFFNPLLISAFLEGDNLNVYIVVDEIPSVEVHAQVSHRLRFEPVTSSRANNLTGHAINNLNLDFGKVDSVVSGTILIAVFTWKSFQPLCFWTVPYQLNTTADLVFSRSVSSILSECGCNDRRNCFIYTSINGTDVNNWVYLSELKDSYLDTNVTVKIVAVTQQSAREFTVQVAAWSPAPFVWLQSGKVLGRFSDNGFLMRADIWSVQFHAWQDVTLPDLSANLTVRSLVDVYKDHPLV